MGERELTELAGQAWALDYTRAETEDLLGRSLSLDEWTAILAHWAKLDRGLA